MYHIIVMFKKIKYVVGKKQSIQLVGIFALMLISATLDLLSLSIILPVISLIANQDGAIASSKTLSLLSKVFRTTDVNSLFIITLAVVLILFLVKAVYGFIYTFVMSKFSLGYSKSLTKKLMNTYLSMPYEYHLENNSSTLIRKSIYDVSNFVFSITDFLDLFVKILTFVAIFVYLMFISYVVTLITAALLIGFSLLIVFVLRPQTRKISKKVQTLNSNNYKYLSQAFEGIKESKISGTEANFSKIYDDNRGMINDLALHRNLLSSIPRHCIEFIGILAICLSLYIVKMYSGLPTGNIIEIFTVFVYAVIKLLPLLISSTSIINSMSFYKTSIDSIYDDVKAVNEYKLEEVKENDEVKVLPFEKEIEIKGLSYAYTSAKDKIVLKDVNLKIKKNSSVVFSGASGAGKTTLIDIVLGLLKPTKGTVTADGQDIFSNIKGWRANISYIPQNIYLSDDTIRNNIAFGLNENEIDDKKVIEALKKAEIYDFVMSLKDGLNTIIGERGIRISGGQRQRIGIARAFYRNTNIIVFDEATSSLDVDTEKQIFDHIMKMGKDHTVIIVTHHGVNLSKCDEHYIVEDNKVIKQK